MSKYADLRWKIADLEKKLEEEKIINKRYQQEISNLLFQIYDKDKECEEMASVIKRLGADSEGKKNEFTKKRK